MTREPGAARVAQRRAWPPCAVWLAAATAGTVLAGGALAQGQATAPTRITTAFPSGSGPDMVARLVAERLAAKWGQPVIVEAKPGGAGVVAINAVKRAPPTGNDLVVVDVGNLSINPLIFKKLGYDPDRDLVPVALLYKTAFFITVAADSPLRSVKDLLVAANAKPGGVSYAFEFTLKSPSSFKPCSKNSQARVDTLTSLVQFRPWKGSR